MKKMIRAAAVAKHIGISSQDLRKMLSEVNFGVKPTDREFPEMVANGIVRFAGRKLKKDIEPLISQEIDEEEEIEESEDTLTLPKKEEEENEEKAPAKKESAFEKLNRLGKQKVEEKKPEPKKPTSSSPAIFRKIEVDPKESAAAKIAHEEQQKKSKEDREREAIEKKAMERKKKKTVELVKKEGVVEIPDAISIKEFSEKVGVPAGEIIAVLMKNGMMVTMTQTIDFDTLSLIASEIDVEIKREEGQASAEDLKERNLEQLIADDPENLIDRPPVIVVMGHVDHGKTKILDAIRETKVVEGRSWWNHSAYWSVSSRSQKEKINVFRYPRTRSVYRHACPRSQNRRYRNIGSSGRRGL
jgi:hypothetical protein